tara:strand:- start:2030 stop:2332 length:303 start_codon:yes stop_codon:yes gene_type:complete
MEELYDLVEHAIDNAFESKDYSFNCYAYLTQQNVSKESVKDFITSSTAGNTALIIRDLRLYIEEDESTATEAYGHLGKERARVVIDYLYAILNDVVNYSR